MRKFLFVTKLEILFSVFCFYIKKQVQCTIATF